jgi:hypothetical protein
MQARIDEVTEGPNKKATASNQFAEPNAHYAPQSVDVGLGCAA